MKNGYFSATRDREVIEAGGFFCTACLMGKPASDQSADPRYCQGCYEFLLEEAELYNSRRNTAWHPEKADKKAAHIPRDMRTIMATVKDKISTVAIIPSSVRKVARGKRGPKHKALPVELIMQWAGEGMGSKKIAARLGNEYGLEVSFRTVARVISGDRRQLALPISET